MNEKNVYAWFCNFLWTVMQRRILYLTMEHCLYEAFTYWLVGWATLIKCLLSGWILRQALDEIMKGFIKILPERNSSYEWGGGGKRGILIQSPYGPHSTVYHFHTQRTVDSWILNKMGHPGPLFHLFSVFSNKRIGIKVPSAGIRTRILLNISLLP